ncbi:MAG TPA: Calx-beta domain-containing protein, partial [Bacteroidales bacterium]|nr:Calx-beta domain-containing protein [Bacteroidales bacterium]
MILTKLDWVKKRWMRGSILFTLLLATSAVYSQTPGMIFENRGISVLDPNLDGFISKTTTGFSTADKFSNQQSEIPYVPFAVVQMEPTSDPGPGPNCFFNDFDDIREYGEPMYSYFDKQTAGGPYLLFRIRLSGYAPNSKSYSVFIDIDGKFGNPAKVGATAGDPNYTADNPGFEIEIYLATNFGVGIYNIDGVHSGTSTDPNNINAKDGTYPYASHAHKALAWKYAIASCNDGQEYFYDFYIPWSAVTALSFSGATQTAIGGTHVTSNTPLRMIGATIMNPNPGFDGGVNNASLSDFGGIDGNGTPEELVTKLINVFPPTTPEQIDDNQRIAPRSDCPHINTPIAGSTAVSGTSTEDDGTIIKVYVSSTSGFASYSTYTTTVSAGKWNASIPGGLVANYYVKATAQNLNETYGSVSIAESVSYDDCDIEQVTVSCDENKTPAVSSVTEIGGRKGFTGSITNPFGHNMQISLYDNNNNLVTLDVGAPSTNPTYTTGTTWEIKNAVAGNSFPSGIYYVVSRDLTTNICPSDYEYICMSSSTGDYKNVSSIPTITTPVSSSATSLAGTTNGEASSVVQVYINGVVSQASVTGTNWTLSSLSFSGCENIKVVQYRTVATAKCVSAAVTTTVSSRTASIPVISGSYCAGTGKTVFGTSSEPDGATIEVYQGASLLSSTTVSNGKWAIYNQALAAGSTLTAKVPAGICLNASASSAGVTVGSKTSNTGMSVSPLTVEGATSVTVTAPSSGGPYTLKLYIDYYHENAWTSPALAAGSSYTFTGLTDELSRSLIYAGARLTVTADNGTNCESDPSAEFEVPCNLGVIQSTKTLTAVSPVCSGNASLITIENSQKGIMYQVYNGSNNPIGYTAAGDGGNITISTGNLTYGGVAPALDPQSFTVKAIRMVPTTTQCITALNGGTPVIVNVKQDIGPVNLTVTPSPSPTNICPGGTFTAKVSSSQVGVNYEMFNNLTNASLSSSVAGNSGDAIITSNIINGSGNIPVRITASSGSCMANLSTIIAVQLKDVPLATASNNGPVCTGSTLNLTGGPSGNTYSWSGPAFTSTSMSPTVTTNAVLTNSGTYTLTVTGTNGCTATASTNAIVATNNPNITIADASISEGNSGTKNLNFTVSLSSAACSNLSVSYATSNGTATTADNDYTATSGTLTINAGNTSGTIAVPIIGDTNVEGDQSFSITLSSPTIGTLTDATAIGTIQEDDSMPTVTLSRDNATISEAGGVCTFTATLSSVSASDVTVQLSVSGTAIGGGTDYTLSSSSITIKAGFTTGSVTVTAVNDDIYESATDETVIVDISSVTNAAEDGVQQASTGIVDNDGLPSLSINDASASEGNDISYTISLSNPSYQTITVSYATSDGTATTVDNDYTSVSSTTLTFNPGETSKIITVSTIADSKYEADETVYVTLSSQTNSTITDASGVGTITNDNSQPTISIDDVSVVEGGSLGFTVTLSNASYQTITVSYATSDGTATTADNDYTSIPSTVLTFNPGETTKSVNVSTTADTKYETNETLNVSLSGASNATISDATGVGTITNDDSQPTISIDDVSVVEGGSLGFTVTLSNASYQTITVSYATSNGTATTADNDYTSIASTVLTFNPGETTKSVNVSTTADTKYETNETLNVSLS